MTLDAPLYKEISDVLLSSRAGSERIYLVGGCIRDHLTGRPTHDYDFVFQEQPLKAARAIADAFGGAFFILDKDRQIGRALITDEAGEKAVVDCSLIQGEDLRSDLRQRDFTINAIALDLTDMESWVDPLGGIQDLENKVLRLCSPASIVLDPVRSIRAVRFIQSFELDLNAETVLLIQEGAELLSSVSSERIRDEVFTILGLDRFEGSIALLESFHLMPVVFPEVIALKEVVPGLPHTHNAFNHTVRVVEISGALMRSMLQDDPGMENEFLDQAVSMLGKYRTDLKEYLQEQITPDRPILVLAHFAALYHDSAKSRIEPVFKSGKNSFPGHARLGAVIAAERARELALSNDEIDFISRIIRNHMKKEFRPGDEMENLDLWLYRFFKEAGRAGIAGCFLHLADIMATYEDDLPPERWDRAIHSVERIMDAWFNRYDRVVRPPRLLNGNEIMGQFDMKPGEEIGRLLEEIREKQVLGIIQSRDDAFNYVQEMIGGQS